ncbi:hypothetical protein CMI37_36670 [Candidatus Pacearchaeota archaeon]|nr:hypothetical protein [Candidatus Pacearchaeota archaeon]
MANTNPCGKTRKLEDPYEVWNCRMEIGFEVLNIEYRVLKKYQSPKKEAENPFARWFTAAKSEATFGSWEYGDTYVRDIVSSGRRTQ